MARPARARIVTMTLVVTLLSSPAALARPDGIAPAISGDLGRGAEGDAVKELQQVLVDLGFTVAANATGTFGPQTEKAVANFQAHAGLPRTGRVDATTRAALARVAPARGTNGQRAGVPVARFEGKRLRVLVVKAEHRTFLFDDQGKVARIFPNAVGKPATPTPSGLKRIDAKLGRREAEEIGQRRWGDPDVFGERIVGLSGGGQELHGTNAMHRLGEDVSHGCVRHANEHILVLFDAVEVGELVAIVDRADDPRLR